MDDQAVIERLRSDLRAQRDADLTPDGLLDAAHRRWRRRRARRAGAGVVLAAVALVGAGLVAIGRGDDQGSVDTGPTDTAPTETTTTRPPAPSTSTTSTTPPVPTGPPSQSPEDAARDGVVPAVAEIPLAGRVDVQAEVAAPEGRWALSRLADVDGRTCEGPGEGRPLGVELICGWREVLLRDEAGTILRAYPMWEITPSWIHLTPDAVLGGRVGDGAQPYSSIFRIDRQTRELTGILFADPGSGEGLFPTTAASWRPAPDEVSFAALVSYDGTDLGTEATSAEGPISVDVAAIEALFAGG